MTQRLLRILGVLVLLLAACGPAASPVSTTPGASLAVAAGPATFPVTITDFQSRSVTVAARPVRIVSI